MKLRLAPRSLLGQMLLAVALGLLVAQFIAAALLLRAQDQRREELLLNSVAFRLIIPERDRTRARFGDDPPPRMRFGIEHSDTFTTVQGDARHERREVQLREILGEQGYVAHDVMVVTRRAQDDPVMSDWLSRRPERAPPQMRNQEWLVAGLKSTPDSDWVIARVPVPEREKGALGGIIGQTLILYFVLVGGMALWLKRITRPLAALTARVEHFAKTREIHGQVEPAGPSDTRRLIEAHNEMESRIAALLDEKDVMLGAIGHDLKTPLAALRVRIESVEDDIERQRMAASIEDITRTLDDILSLARVGKPTDRPENTEMAALAASVVEEFEDMGEEVVLGETTRIALPVRATWLRRALRNLIANALRYGGGRARVSLHREDDFLAIRVEDDGEGIPEDEIDAMLEPFRRGDPSRNRETGGAGLGLTLARAIADQHKGSLKLANRVRSDGSIAGLMAEIRLPVSS
ncbi:MAG TPA: ATP-binding protein [Sphingomonadaceae bacterium]|nr:ATP-binding protein [Sphingomonadaceae bacterium]